MCKGVSWDVGEKGKRSGGCRLLETPLVVPFPAAEIVDIFVKAMVVEARNTCCEITATRYDFLLCVNIKIRDVKANREDFDRDKTQSLFFVNRHFRTCRNHSDYGFANLDDFIEIRLKRLKLRN